MADSVDLIAFVMNGGRLLEAAEQGDRVNLSSWLDEHENVDSLLSKFPDGDPAVVKIVSESESGGDGDVGSPDVDVESVDLGDVVVPETPESCDCDSCAGDTDSDSDISDISISNLSDDVFWPAEEEEKEEDDKTDSVDVTAAGTCEVGDPSTYSDISDAEEDDDCGSSVGNRPVSGCDYSDISSTEDEREYMSPSNNNDDDDSPAGPRFDYPDTDGHIGNWLPTVYSASWVHEDPNDCAATDVNCPPPPEGSRAKSVCLLTNRPNYFGCVIRNFASDPDFGADSDSEDDDCVCEGDYGNISSVCNVSVDSGLYSCDDDDLQTDYDGDSECDSPAVPAAAVEDEEEDDDVYVVETVDDDSDSDGAGDGDTADIEAGGDVVMELAGCDGFVKRYVLHDSPVSLAPGFGDNSKLVCAGLGAIGVAEKRLCQIRENDSGLRHILNVSNDRAAIEKPGVDGETQLVLTGPMEYKSIIQLGSEHHDYLNTQLIVRQYAEKGVPAWFDAMRVTLSASSGERYSISAPQSEWREFYGYFGDFLDNPLEDLVCVISPSPKNFPRVFEKVQNAKYIFIYTSRHDVGGSDPDLVKFLKLLSGGFMPVEDGCDLLFLTHKPVVVVFREQEVAYPKCTPMIQFVCHDVLPAVYDGDGADVKPWRHMCACEVCLLDYRCRQAEYWCKQSAKMMCSVAPMSRKRKRDDDEDDEDLQAALMASVHPDLRAPSTFGYLSDEDSDNVVVRECADGSFAYGDDIPNRPPCRRRRTDVAPRRRRRGRPIRFTRRAENVVDASEMRATSSPFITINVIDGGNSDDASRSGAACKDDLPEIDNSPIVVREDTVAREVSAAPAQPVVAPEPPVVRARTLRLTTRRTLGPRK